MRDCFNHSNSYLLDPHTAVAVAAVNQLVDELDGDVNIICLATAHPAKFPQIIKKCLETDGKLPAQAQHISLQQASRVCQQLRLCDIEHLEFALVDAISNNTRI